nr:hypothetical protein [Tanacetum cinerariifolium]
HVHGVQPQANGDGVVQMSLAMITYYFRQSAAPGTARAPDDTRCIDRGEVRQTIQVLRITGVVQWQLAQGCSRALAHEPGGRDESV